MTTVALTDHDTAAGWDEAVAAAEVHGIGLVRGMEISCTYRGHSMHLLGYLVDPEQPELVEELRRALDSRATRLERMVAKMAAAGLPITMDAVRAQMGAGTTPGRPHIADALVAEGYFSHRDEAFATVLRTDSPYYVSHYAIPAVRGVEVVRAAGGVPVVAHPYADVRGHRHPASLLVELAEAGLAGVEVDHRDQNGPARAELRGLAQDLDLLVTGSSDYHGSGKHNRLGENTTAPEVLEALVAQATGAVQLVAPRSSASRPAGRATMDG